MSFAAELLACFCACESPADGDAHPAQCPYKSASLPVKIDKFVHELTFADFAFRNSQNAPTLRSQKYSRFFISCSISLYLIQPILPIGVRYSAAANTSVPETTVYEDCYLPARPSEIRLSAYRPLLSVAGKPCRSKEACNSPLRAEI